MLVFLHEGKAVPNVLRQLGTVKAGRHVGQEALADLNHFLSTRGGEIQ